MTRTLKATLLVNPAAHRVGEGFDGQQMARYMTKNGVETTIVIPHSEADAAEEAANSAKRGDDLLFAIGGDGSVRTAARGLAGSETALAAIPAGTVNVWAKEAGIPTHSLKAAIDSHLTGQSVHMDLGRANGACFLLMAGIGWDAEVASKVNLKLKKKMGDVAYMAQAAWMAPRLRTRQATWTEGDEKKEEPLAWMVLGNTRLYGGRIRMTRDAVLDDGLFDGIALCPRGVAETARLARKLATGKRDDERLLQFQAKEVVFETPGFPVQLDGDPVGETPMTFTIEPGGLLVSVPSGPLAPIFGREHKDRRETPGNAPA